MLIAWQLLVIFGGIPLCWLPGFAAISWAERQPKSATRLPDTEKEERLG